VAGFRKGSAIRLRRAGQVFVLVSLLTLLAAWNTGTQLFFLLFALAFALVLISLLAAFTSLRRLRLARYAPHAVHRGEPFPVEVRLETRRRFLSSFCIHLETADNPGVSVGFILRLPPKAVATLNVSQQIGRRGVHLLPDLLVISAFPFGLAETRRRFQDDVEVVVYPRVRPLRASAMQENRGARGIRQRSRGEGEEFFSLREYVRGDDLRRIAWRASARANELLVREVESERVRTAVLIVDTRRPAEAENPDDLVEDTIELAASYAVSLLQQQYSVAVLTPLDYVADGEGPSHAITILDQLARAEVLPATAPDPHDRLHVVGDLRQVAFFAFSPDPVDWGRADPVAGRTIDPREVVYA
jgi:uncharacterized protein (DUF58 family)